MSLTPSENKEYLFVYGTLRRGQRNPMNLWLKRNAEFSGVGKFRGRLYDLGSYPAALPSRGGDATVIEDIYLLRNAERILKVLDTYEGKRFQRIRTAVTSLKRKKIVVWVYILKEPVIGRATIPVGDYVRYLKETHG